VSVYLYSGTLVHIKKVYKEEEKQDFEYIIIIFSFFSCNLK